MKSWYCKSKKHKECRGKTLKDGIGPVEVIPCSCDCHPPIQQFTLDTFSPIPPMPARVYGDRGKQPNPRIDELRKIAERRRKGGEK